MPLWPIILSLLVLAIAYAIFYVLPEIIDFDLSFLWVIAGFLVLYGIAAFALSHSIPSPTEFTKGSFDIKKFMISTVDSLRD